MCRRTQELPQLCQRRLDTTTTTVTQSLRTTWRLQLRKIAYVELLGATEIPCSEP